MDFYDQRGNDSNPWHSARQYAPVDILMKFDIHIYWAQMLMRHGTILSQGGPNSISTLHLKTVCELSTGVIFSFLIPLTYFNFQFEISFALFINNPQSQNLG